MILSATAAGTIALLLQLGCEPEHLDRAFSLLATRHPRTGNPADIVEQFSDCIELARLAAIEEA